MNRDSTGRMVWRIVLALFYGAAGVFHLILPAPFIAITPHWVPLPASVVLWTGLAELAGAIGLMQPFSLPLRRAAAIGLAAYAVCVFPANINHMMIDLARPDSGAGLSYHGPRMVFQPLVIWLALWAGGVTSWPLGRR